MLHQRAKVQPIHPIFRKTISLSVDTEVGVGLLCFNSLDLSLFTRALLIHKYNILLLVCIPCVVVDA